MLTIGLSNSSDRYKDKLYEDAVEEKLVGARYFLRSAFEPDECY